MKDLNLNIPSECGVMLLSEVSLFPNCSMMLNIFEPRYRTMLQDSLADSWMFATGDMNEAALSSNAGLDFGVISVIRFCKHLPDGRSSVVLKGLQPVRFSSWDKSSPYPKAQISPLVRQEVETNKEQKAIRSLVTDSLPTHLEHLSKEIRNTILSDLSSTPSLSALIDQVSHNFISDTELRLSLLSETDDRKRAHTLITALAT